MYVVKGDYQHVVYTAIETMPILLKYAVICNVFGILTPVLGKMSVDAVIVRILGGIARWRLWTLYIIMAIYLIMSVVTVIMSLTKCALLDAI
jgi:hypothetical protein